MVYHTGLAPGSEVAGFDVLTLANCLDDGARDLLLPTIVTIHAGVYDGLGCDLKDRLLLTLPIVHLQRHSRRLCSV